MSSLPWRILVVTDLGVDGGAPQPVTSDSLDAWFASLPLAIQPSALEPGALIAAGTTGAALDSFLHDPARQRIEAAWRGLTRLLANAGGPVSVEAMSVPRSSLVDRFRDTVHGPGLEAEEPLSLVVLDYDFTHKPSDLAALASLAAMAADLQAPIVAGAGAGFFDLRFLVQAATVKDLAGRLADSAHSGWQAFQKDENARWVSLTLGRFLLREPWTRGDWSEKCADSNPDSYLWGRGAWLVAAAIARSVRAHGHAMDLSGTGGRFDDIATRPYPVKANETQALATEVPLPETSSLELTHAAFTTLTGALGRPSVMMPMVVTAHRYGAGRLTVEGTLSYQLTAARVSLACGVAAGSLDGGAAGAVTGSVTAILREQLGGLLGEADDSLAVQVIEAEGTQPRRVSVTVRPPLVLESKQPVFAMEFAID